jgi:diaminopimelate epimerase
MYNADGSEPEMCGNGIRCMTRFIHEVLEQAPTGTEKTYHIHTLAGEIIPVVKVDGRIAVDMGVPILEAQHVPCHLTATQQLKEGNAAVDSPVMVDGQHEYMATAVSMANPHCVIFCDDIEAMGPLAFDTIGPILECHPSFPEKANAEFVMILADNHLKMKVWERGVGPTLACGTGACAAVVAGVLKGICNLDTKVSLPGGDLNIIWDRGGTGKVFMTGPAELTFKGELVN